MWALMASLLLHILSIGGDTLLRFADAWERDEPLTLRKPTKSLTSMDIPEDEPAHTLAGVKPAEQLSVQFGPAPAKAKAARRVVAAAKAGKTKVVASAVAAATASSASAVASAGTASGVAVVASAPQPVTPAASMVAAAPTVVPSAPETLPTPQPEIPREKQFPRKVEITYLWTAVPVKMLWEVDHGQYKLSLHGGLFGRTRDIVSEGKVGKTGVIPQRFSDTKDGKLLNEATFDWDAQNVQLNDDGKTSLEALKLGDQDLFSAAFQFALQGSKMKNFTFSMVSGRKLYRDVKFELRGEGTLTLGDKRIDAILLRGEFEDRVFEFWLAPEWNNMPVRIHLTLGKENTFNIWASQITINGETVLYSPNQQRQNGGLRR
ncbi:Protein of unknown function [Andreprevotia lacus DSM 23236]|uniref:DUF3108 domain-containing protein n=2 Tax=Andreprevotia TaxID=397275 RepID=A0A1W1XSF6_9NEIS|nr:Protein of unknown function [Andreprevotia lacus DSM 23236]